MDYTYAGWNRKPVAFVSYGGSSGGGPMSPPPATVPDRADCATRAACAVLRQNFVQSITNRNLTSPRTARS